MVLSIQREEHLNNMEKFCFETVMPTERNDNSEEKPFRIFKKRKSECFYVRLNHLKIGTWK